MRPDAKVVQLKPGIAQHSASSPVGRLPAVLNALRDSAAQQLRQAMQALFDNADDTLFEMADRAASNTEQNAYFEAMRDLRLKRKSIEQGFLQDLAESFGNLNQYQIGKPQVLDVVSADNLSLLQNDELEEAVAIDAMEAKVMSRDAAALGQLTARINTLVSKKIEDKSNPLGPRLLCEAFALSCHRLGVEIRIKLIILKLFERYVLSDLDQLYADANQALITAGVLPDLISTPAKRRAPSAATGAAVQESAAGAEADTAPSSLSEGSMQEVFGALQSLLVQVRGQGRGISREQLPEALPITSTDLLRLLSHMQQHVPAPAVEHDFDVRDQLGQLLTRASAKSGKTRVVGEVDEDVINLVSMLFEFILDDRSLPDSLKALIGRLQIPMLKVAVVDKTFFSRGSHPARRLLNEIASAALGWSVQDDSRRDSLYQKIEQIVQRLLKDFVDDSAIFNELLADFLAFTGDERRRSELLEQRTRDAEEGSAKAEMARRDVEDVLNQRLLGKVLPEVVVRLLREAWSKVLMLTCLKHGVDSMHWQQAVSTMDTLILSVDTQQDADLRGLAMQQMPQVLEALREGLEGAAVDPFAMIEFFSQLDALHTPAFVVRPPVASADMPAVEPVAQDPQLQEALSSELLALPDVAPLMAVASAEPEMVEVREAIVLLAPGQSAPVAEPELAADDPHLMQVDALSVGSWVEIQEDEEHKLRCKLAAVIKPTGKYIFVNRTGMKVLEKTRSALALEFSRGSIRLLNDALLFDRALESVIGNLRRLKNV